MAELDEIMDISEMDKNDIRDIKESLSQDYNRENDIDEMLKEASFTPLPAGFVVTYKNGIIDQFVSIAKLIHVDDYNKRIKS